MIKIFLCIVVIGFILFRSFPLIQVVGSSMYPTYKDGEIIVGTRLYRKSKLKVGDVIVYSSPTDNKKVIKRISSILRDGSMSLYCLGDNAEESYDSRYYGYFSSKLVICKVVNQRRKA